ncbi:MAG: DNA polymerase IV [Oscillospiraceae bacterium]
MDRVILHCDLNCFYASVELLSHPELRDVPTAVCGDPSSRHGIILAKNEPAKRFGVQTAETIWQAKKKCPELVLLPPHHALYGEYSRRVNAIYRKYTDLVEPFGIDESWLDMTGSLHLFGGDARAVADEIRGRVRRELGLTLSVGVSFNKVFAKLGSDYKKPDATTVISRENWEEIVRPLPAKDLLFVGKAAQEALGKYGIRTIGDIADADIGMLEALLGKMGLQLHEYASGRDMSPVVGDADRQPVKSVGNGTTFPRNLTRWDEVRTGLSVLSDSVAMRLRQQGLYCGGVQVTLRYADFKTVSRQAKLTAPTHLMKDIYQEALALTKALWQNAAPIRMLTVTALHITEEGESYQQLDLLQSGGAKRTAEKREKLEKAMDGIRDRFGRGSIAYGTPAGGLLQDEEEE